ncbi:MAG: CDP-alcohol phosphatidyltransferase family protein [Bacilli bacterium]|nr:CDP-alcohol phosphatidyltransferase family protein [Bacilli bacterium]
MDKKYKVLIPNLLTLTRIVFTPIIIILSLMGHIKIATVFVIIAAITDLFDGKLARKWNTVSITGAKLDAIADKIFVIGIICSLIPKYNFYIYILILEVIIGLINLYFYYKSNRTESLYIGKFKTTFLFITIILSIISILFINLNKITVPLSYVVINLQLLCIISYTYNYFEKEKNKPKIEDNEMHNEIMNDKDLEYELDKTIVINNLKDIEEKIYDIEKDDLY